MTLVIFLEKMLHVLRNVNHYVSFDVNHSGGDSQICCQKCSLKI